MNVISIKNAHLSFSNLEILKNVSFYINKNERICLMGKNGVGKSTLLQVINKKQDLDKGDIIYKKNIQVSYLGQENLNYLNYLNISIFEFIKKTIKNININSIIQTKKIIEMLKLDKDSLISEVSGGFLRKIALGAVLANNPDVLLLDEPTNHLDIITIKWLENFLNNFSGSVVFISHDRLFIDNICTRIINLDRGKLISFSGGYKEFIKLKKHNDYIENINKKLFDKKLKQEEIWISKGVKARSTRNEGRVKNLKLLRQDNENYKKIKNLDNIQINEIKDYPGNIVFNLKNINFCIKNQTIIKNFSTIVQYGDKIGLIGNNGSGKSTMVKILTGNKKIQKGEFYSGKKVKIAYFDQNKLTLNYQKSILDNINEGKDQILINEKKQHLIGYLKKFLFEPKELQRLVKTLSGGESNRLLLAKLFLQNSNVLIFDEPTNDLDLDTLKLLEKIIIQYSGTVLIVSHDRNFIQNTVKKYWLFEGNGIITTHLGSYHNLKTKEINKNITKKNKKLNIPNKNKSHKELNNVLNQIEKIEKNIKNLQNQINQPTFFEQSIIYQMPILKQLHLEEKKLENKLLYWENLELTSIKK